MSLSLLTYITNNCIIPHSINDKYQILSDKYQGSLCFSNNNSFYF